MTAEAHHVIRITRADQPEPAGDDPTRVVVQDTSSHRADAGVAWGSLTRAYLMQLERYKQALTACGLPVAGAMLAPVRRLENG